MEHGHKPAADTEFGDGSDARMLKKLSEGTFELLPPQQKRKHVEDLQISSFTVCNFQTSNLHQS